MLYLRVTSRLVLGACVLALCTTLTSAQSFELKRYDIHADGNAIARGDFNNDGVLDLVTGNFVQGASLTVFLGNPDGTFRSGISSNVSGRGSQDLAVGDFNHDGKLDVAFVPIGGNQVYILLGKGDGTFQAPIALGTRFTPISVATADFNNDGKLDLAVAELSNSSVQAVEVFAGDGAGNFSRVGEYDFTDTWQYAKVRVGDFNADHKPDLALQLYHSVNVLWGGGDFTFRAQQLGTYTQTADMNTGDINQDGASDILLSYFNNVNNLAGGIDSYFGTISQENLTRKALVTNQYEAPAQLWAVDIDGDGINDIAALDNNQNWHDGLYIWMGNPDGTFQQNPKTFTFTTDRDKTALVPGDFNRDGKIDFAATLVGSGSLETSINATPRSQCHPRTDTASVTVCQPQDYTFSNSPVHLWALASGNKIKAMQIYADNKLVKTVSGKQITADLALGLGDHFLVTKAWDSLGQNFRSDRHVTVFRGAAGQTCSTSYGTASLTLCLPKNNSVLNGAIRVFANAWSPTVITAMQVYIDNALKLNDSTSSFVDQTYAESPGQHYVVVKAWDANGHVSQQGAWVTVQ